MMHPHDSLASLAYSDSKHSPESGRDIQFPGNGGLVLSATQFGDPKSPQVLLLHGGGQTRHAWKNTGETLGAAGYHAVALDARGHGDSGWADAGHYGVDHMIDDIDMVVEALGGKTPILVGASMGGATSLVAVGEGKIAAKALVLVDIAPRIDQEGHRQIQAFLDQYPEGFETLEQVSDAIANYQPHRKMPRNLDGLAKNVRLGDDGRYHWHWDPVWRHGRGSMQAYQDRLREAASRIAVPTLLIRGGLSNVLTEAGAREFLALCPHSDYVNIPTAAHMVAGDRNDVFADAVVEFLGRAVGGDR